ncbi:ClpXP protease specificity-enhancing factor SspB [Enhygromyxa salina]|uniref:Stringent starvation protein B n=1 Tax=Enhygromyxa salina TaxID=215803 RepID=A0A2S9Y138_9BACT|nr:ClpXP protease specificity-enhancing factor SspB [Enhygromyxa salina]PRP98815.1 Stringent starvation protein B [Enhygromyxa salina]
MVHPVQSVVQSVVESLYAAGRCPRLHVNASCEGVVCPDFIREQWQERLIIDLDASYPLDLSFSEDSIGADLSFGGYVTRCSFPWKAVYVVADRATGRGIVLDQNMPESVRRSRQPPTTGPLPAGGDLSNTFDHETAQDRRVGGPSKPHRRKPKKAAAVPAAASVNSGSSVGPVAEADPQREDEAKRRRSAFKVIDGGS